MALADQPINVSQRGSWPGRIFLRRGWARAEARPWNDDEPQASLRLLRGGSSFLQACVARLIGLGATGVISPPLPASAQRSWQQAGFTTYVDLALMRKSLEGGGSAPDHLVIEGADCSLEELLAIDVAAFPPFWRFNREGLEEAIQVRANRLHTRSSVLGALSPTCSVLRSPPNGRVTGWDGRS